MLTEFVDGQGRLRVTDALALKVILEALPPPVSHRFLAGAAVMILAVDSNQLFTSGFQLSFAVVGAILLWQEPCFRALLRPSATDPFLPRSLVSRGRRAFETGYRKIASGFSVSAAAWAGSLLLIIWYFYLVTPISLLANLVVVPVAFGGGLKPTAYETLSS